MVRREAEWSHSLVPDNVAYRFAHSYIATVINFGVV